jgi:hypothetical protein
MRGPGRGAYGSVPSDEDAQPRCHPLHQAQRRRPQSGSYGRDRRAADAPPAAATALRPSHLLSHTSAYRRALKRHPHPCARAARTRACPRPGQVGIIPTDSLPAVVCDLENRDAVLKLYACMQLAPKKQLSVLCRWVRAPALPGPGRIEMASQQVL